MKMVLTSPAELVIEHAGQSLYWSMTSFDKQYLTTEHGITRHINEFWAKQSAYKQEKIFGIYSAIRNCLELNSDMQPLVEGLIPLVAQLCDEHPLEDLSHWMNFYSDISTPSHFIEEYQIKDEKSRTRDKTYIRSDYHDLATMALCLRTMLPVWGEFIKRMVRETGNVFKEYRAFQLLAQSTLMQSAPMEKLRVYVGHNIQAEKMMASAIMKGVGTQDYPMWLLSLVVVRRVCVGDLNVPNPKTNLVTFIHNYINNKVSVTNSSSFGEIVKSKEFESGDSNTDLNVSRIEGYKLKQEAPIGDMVILEYFMENPLNVVQLLKPDVSVALFEEFFDHAQVLQKELLYPHQLILTQWVLKPVFPPRGLTQLSKRGTINAIAVAQTVLWEKGHFELAGLLTATSSNTVIEMSLGGTGTRAKITKLQMEELTKLYPYTKALSTKKATKPANSATNAIDSVADMLEQSDWVLTLPDRFALKITGKENTRRYSAPGGIKVMLADLAIQIAKRQ